MTPEEIQELRDWSARKMGWVEIIPQIHAPMVYYGKASDDPPICSCVVVKSQWLPDRPESGQIWMLVEKFEDDGAEIIIHKYETKVFYRGLWHFHTGEGMVINTLKALHKAARATED